MELLQQLIKNDTYWIRFELTKSELNAKTNFNVVTQRAMTIFNELFAENDEMFLINCIDQSINDTQLILPKFKRYLRNKKQIYNLNYNAIELPHNEHSDIITHEYFLKVQKEDIRLNYLLDSIKNADYNMKPQVNGYIYLINVTKEIMFYMYDDRGCIVKSLHKDSLLPLYKNYSSWILDYDRVQIDRSFELGLYNIFETSDEAAKRIHFNQLKIDELGIRTLYADQYVTHHLKIPKANATVCLEALNQTGFKIDVKLMDENYLYISCSKFEPPPYIDYQSELMALYAKKFNGIYTDWTLG